MDPTQTCITEAGKLKLGEPAMALERDVLVYRAYLALRKWRVVLEEVGRRPSSLVTCPLSLYHLSPDSR